MPKLLPRAILIVIAAACLAFVLLAVACGGDDDSTGGSSVPPSRTPAVLPSNFPPEFPVYQGATLFRVMDRDGSYTIEWHADKKPGDVIPFYLQALDVAPWSITTSDTSNPDAAVVNFQDASKYDGLIGIGALGSSGTKILVSLKPRS